MNSGVVVRELSTTPELTAANDVLERVWQSADGGVQVDLLRALGFGGGYIAGAFLDDHMVGAAVGFLARADAGSALHLHSHAAGVLPEAQGRHVGLSLKLHQRTWAIEHGYREIRWTFDPLQARNAAFNLTRLGAQPIAYHIDFYGQMDDAFNSGSASDRLLVSWRLDAPIPDVGEVATLDAAVALSISSGGAPEEFPTEANVQLWAIPSNISELRRRDPDLAGRWRDVTRRLFSEALAAGATVTFVPGRGYRVDKFADARRRAIAALS